MANWCNNVVWFEADETTTKKIKEMFLQMAKIERETDCGQLPPFISIDKDWFFDIRWEVENVLYYNTKWSPNTEILRQIAEHFKVDFTLEYEELSCAIYGRATYAKSILTDIYLDREDFKAYQSDQGTDSYFFEGETYESEWEILETLLERKIANNN
ncbi:hypothetical protein CMT56_15445 [Elizabethkingia anophelis]|jgi:hypothetical protein|nr:hypothetical protein [Elizabethkingia anophelis]MDV3861053.1 hypothetical protein [Elizabethkingia anophelis]MDV3908805.1 hypothetical protein [Elizabethkingia anophelis]MDV3925370.1 hypothetical protein [Elizabethkingia anophelis]MDV3989408.1 hypothetical protein [Elizabethkingia anophelis]